MARVEVINSSVKDGTIESVEVNLAGLGKRTLDRDAVLAWMRDGHSFIPVVDGADQQALVLVEIVNGDEVAHYVRSDAQKQAADQI